MQIHQYNQKVKYLPDNFYELTEIVSFEICKFMDYSLLVIVRWQT